MNRPKLEGPNMIICFLMSDSVTHFKKFLFLIFRNFNNPYKFVYKRDLSSSFKPVDEAFTCVSSNFYRFTTSLPHISLLAAWFLGHAANNKL